jgi:hypothetical protein
MILGGGLAGAILNNIMAKRKNRIQPIIKKIQISNIFIPNELTSPHITKITFSDSKSQDFHFENLSIAQIEIKNNGNIDYEKFEFGITLVKFIAIINLKVSSANRHHSITFEPNINFNQKSNIVDFTLCPFNRKETYEITLFLTSDNKKNIDSTEILKFSSKYPVKFIDYYIMSKTILEMLLEMLAKSNSIFLSQLSFLTVLSKSKKLD